MSGLRGTMQRGLLVGGLLLFACALLLTPSAVRADGPTETEVALFTEVMPGADAFSEKEGDPPVFKAYSTDPETGGRTLVGYVFLTSDVPPEQVGYSAPIDVLVGMDLGGTLTGIKVLRYTESIRRIMGDFLGRPGFQEQFTGKSITDPLRVNRDVDGISRATITVAAMTRGIRFSARRVAETYFTEPEAESSREDVLGDDASALAQLERLSWAEMLASGLVTRIAIGQSDPFGLEMSFAYIGDEALGQLLVGPDAFARARAVASVSNHDHRLLVVGIDGSLSNLFDPERLAIQQGGEIFPVSEDDFIRLDEPVEGKMADQAPRAGVLLVDPAVDVARSFTILYDLRPAMGLFSGEYTPAADVLAALQQSPDSGLPGVGANQPVFAFSLAEIDDETALDRLVDQAPQVKVFALLFLFVLAIYAFLRKSATVRWVILAYTLIYLGFIDGSFLSISHITSGVNVGPSLFSSDLLLLLVVAFTVLTTLLWGRVFCGFVCPFGAVQIFLARLVPLRFQRELPQAIHDRAVYIKYGLLGLILILAVASSDTSVFQYFEPFGTAFYISPSLLLWAILLGILAASAVVPQFYCRYACPLGAALGLASFLTLFRIKRVDQCSVCKLCEQRCPTGAIRGPEIEFKECIRCNICETQLATRAGSCRHDMEGIRARFKNWQPAPLQK